MNNFYFVRHIEEPRPNKSYRFVSVNGSGNLGVSMPLTREMKENKWFNCFIDYDQHAKVIRLTKTTENRSSHEVRWQHIKADLRPFMPRGRYKVLKDSSNSYLLQFEG